MPRWKGLIGLPWNPGHSGVFRGAQGAQVQEQVGCLPVLGNPPWGGGQALSSGVWPQGSVHAAAPEEGASGHPLPCCSSLSQNTHGFYRFLERGPWKGSLRWENPRGAGPAPVTLVSRASRQPSPGDVCRRTAQRLPPPPGSRFCLDRLWRRNTRLFPEFKLNNKVQRQLLWSHICNTSDCGLIIGTSLPARVRSQAMWHGDSCGFQSALGSWRSVFSLLHEAVFPPGEAK